MTDPSNSEMAAEAVVGVARVVGVGEVVDPGGEPPQATNRNAAAARSTARLFIVVGRNCKALGPRG
jgi:hypothetical protein